MDKQVLKAKIELILEIYLEMRGAKKWMNIYLN